jgi:hypothetical protein
MLCYCCLSGLNTQQMLKTPTPGPVHTWTLLVVDCRTVSKSPTGYERFEWHPKCAGEVSSFSIVREYTTKGGGGGEIVHIVTSLKG